MVFLVQDFVNLPADQIANIWLAAHMKKKLNKKDIKKTKLSAACSQLHSDKTKKPMQLRHYGQCLIGISWIHLKQVEFLHNDCNDAFSKARLVLVRKRNVDLDPSDNNNARDITLPAQRNQPNEEVLDIDLNAVNFSQLDMDLDDNASDVASVLGSISHNGAANDALDHEITMQSNELTTVSPRADRRSSFGGMSSILMGDLGDMDIEIRFDDDDDDEVLEESQAKKASNDTMASLSATDNNSQVEKGRGANDHTLLHENMSDNGSAASALAQQSGPADMRLSLLSDNHSQVSLAKEKSGLHLDDMSANGSHSGSAMNAIPENMDIDDGSLMDDQQSLHVQFDLDAQSVNGSVATALVEPREEATPPSSPRGASQCQGAAVAAAAAEKAKVARKKAKKKKRKARFHSDKKIELSTEELRVAKSDLDSAPFVHPAGRDALHIWREFPLSSLPFDELLKQPLSRQQFGRFTDDMAKRFALCLERPRRKGDGPAMGGIGNSDELANLDILREHDDEAEKGRDDDEGSDAAQGDLMGDMSLQMNGLNDFSMDSGLEMDAIEQHAAMDESARPLMDRDDDAASTLDSVMDDRVAPPNDPLYNDPIDPDLDLPVPGELPDEESCLQEGEEDDIDMPGAGAADPLSFNTEDQNIMTQMPTLPSEHGIKPRDWSRRAKKTFAFFRGKDGDEFSFDELMGQGTKRQTVVGVFYELLVFKNSDLVDLKQSEPYGDITITKTANFHRHAEMSQQLSQRRR